MDISNKVMLQDNPSIGIVTPTYNRNKLLKRFLKQINGQSYDNWYLAVVHDGANQETQKLIKQFAGNDEKVTYLCTRDHSNDYGTTPRMEGARYLVKEKSVQYLVFWDDDNSFHKNALNVIAQAILANGYTLNGLEVNFFEKNTRD
jgi:glycosyltransferase involved in cell wall biosynthesis